MVVAPTQQRKFKTTYTGEEYKDAVHAAYKLGLMDGRQKRQELFLLLQKTNRRLWEELIALDKNEPLEGIVLTVEQAESIRRQLKRPGIHNTKYWVNLLGEKLKKSARLPLPDVQSATKTEAWKKETSLTKRIDENYRKNIEAMHE